MEANRNISGAGAEEIRAASSPKDVFLHLLLILTLLMSVISFITLIFQYINVLIFDPLYFGDPYERIRWATSVLIVAWPVFIGVSWLLHKEFISVPQKRELLIRKWLIYLTLFVAAIVIIIDLMVLIYNFYGGDLTTNFLLKILVVLAVAAVVFSYYLWDLRNKETNKTIPRQFAWAASIIVITSIVAGFFIAGSPAKQRAARFDTERTGHLQMIQSEIVNFWTHKERLPADLDELEDEVLGVIIPRDPVTDKSYEYNVEDDLTFELCAEFQTDSRGFTAEEEPGPVPPIRDPFGPDFRIWVHEAGYNCFERTIDPDRMGGATPEIFR